MSARSSGTETSVDPPRRDGDTSPVAGGGVSRRSVVRAGIAGLLGAPFATSLVGAARPRADATGPLAPGLRWSGGRRPQPDDEIVLGVSAAFSGPSRGLGTDRPRNTGESVGEVGTSELPLRAQYAAWRDFMARA